MQFPKTFHSLKKMQETNRTTILRAFFANAPISRSEIAKQTGLSLSIVSRLVKDLLQERLLVEAGKLELMRGSNREF
ncbi:MAG TPA: winged helix-turn-helix domain-containing protein [Firmicutes bacterium]|nr:winged helix-turn-helix domain-containing protein [Bacillota bacterium]